jgi:hypothetical protein
MTTLGIPGFDKLLKNPNENSQFATILWTSTKFLHNENQTLSCFLCAQVNELLPFQTFGFTMPQFRHKTGPEDFGACINMWSVPSIIVIFQIRLDVKEPSHQSDEALHQSHPRPPCQAVYPSPPPIISHQFSKHDLPQKQQNKHTIVLRNLQLVIKR